MFSITVRDFGPIAKGEVQLRPLTIFIGPNNAGKSYFALLIYSLLHTLLPIGRFHFSPLRFAKFRFSDKMEKQFNKWIKSKNYKDKEEISYKDIPYDLLVLIDEYIKESSKSFEDGIKRCFTCDIHSLIRHGSTQGINININNSNPPYLYFEFKSNTNDHFQGKYKYDLEDLTINYHKDIYRFFLNILQKIMRDLPSSLYYLPAARSGILQSHKALASIIVSRSPFAGIEPMEIPTLSGVVADFISNLLQIGPVGFMEEKNKEILSIASLLEKDISHGEIILQPHETKFGYPEILYKIQGESIPLQRTSSMISELAPIILYLRYFIQKDNLLIIEEPEAHLHPDNQRILALCIVKLIRAGVRIIITTHSDYFIQQISNFIKLGAKTQYLHHLKYKENDFLKEEEVGAYLFKHSKKLGGSTVEKLNVTSENGIPDDEFARIAEQLYNETVKIDYPTEITK